jgi:hypothetical protein
MSKNENAELKRRIKPKTYSKTVLQIHRCRFWELSIIQSISKIIIFVLFFLQVHLVAVGWSWSLFLTCLVRRFRRVVTGYR